MARYYLLRLFEKDTEWYSVDHWWLILVLRLRNAEKGFVHLRPVGGRFSTVLMSSGADCVVMILCTSERAFSIWKCPMLGSWARVLFMYLVTWKLQGRPLKVHPQDSFWQRIGPLISIPSTIVWTWPYLSLVFMGKHSISADVRGQIIIMSFKLPLNLEESLLT